MKHTLTISPSLEQIMREQGSSNVRGLKTKSSKWSASKEQHSLVDHNKVYCETCNREIDASTDPTPPIVIEIARQMLREI